MSATHKTKAERGRDFFETPSWVVDAIVPHLPCALDVLDPCAGKGAILKALGAAEGRKFANLRGIEIDPAHLGPEQPFVDEGDALSLDWETPRLVVMNPPFGLAQEFLEKALAEIAPGGTVAALLRLAFLESTKRAGFHRAAPADVFVLARRPSFIGGKTDSSAYGWFVYGPGRGGRWFVLGGEP